MRTLIRWALFVLSIICMGLWFLRSPFRQDEKWFFADNFGLDSTLGEPNDGKDSMEEAWEALRTAPLKKIPHQLKNLSHEWARECPKRAVKFLSFVILVQAIVIGVL